MDEITQDLYGFGVTEESDTEIGGSQIELAKIADAAKFKAVMPDDVLSHTDPDAFKKVLCTKITGNDTLTEDKEAIQSGEFQEPNDDNLSKPKTGIDLQELKIGKEPVVYEKIMPDDTSENDKSSLDIINDVQDVHESTISRNEQKRAEIIYNKSVQNVHELTMSRNEQKRAEIIDSYIAIKVLCTKSAGKDVIAKCTSVGIEEVPESAPKFTSVGIEKVPESAPESNSVGIEEVPESALESTSVGIEEVLESAPESTSVGIEEVPESAPEGTSAGIGTQDFELLIVTFGILWLVADASNIIQESNRSTLQSELGRVTAVQAELSSSDLNVEPNPKENCTEIVSGMFTTNNYCAENVTGIFTINNGKESAKIKYFGSTPGSNDRIEYESNKYSYDENSEVKYVGSQPRKKYQLDRPKNDANLHPNNLEESDFGKNAKVYVGKDYE